MKKVAYVSNFYAIPPFKGAAVQTWTNEVAKRLWFYESHTICVDDEFLPLKEYRDGVYHHRIRLSKIYKRIFQKILGWDIYSYNDRVFNEVKKINLKKDGKIIIGFVERIANQKNVEYIIELAREFKNLPEYYFKIVDEIIRRKDNYEYYKSLVKKIKEYNLNNIEFLDNISPDKVHAAYNDFDFTIIPLNDKESFCMVGIEAMSCENFVIARAGGGSKEYMVDNENCKLFEFENFAKEVKEYILNLKEPERHRITSSARKMCEENFSWNKIAEDTQKFYKEILNDTSK